MPKVNPEIETFARIRVIGIGGAGGNAINHMVKTKIRGVDFVAINTDAQDLHKSLADRKIHIGKNLTKGLGSGMNPEIGKQSAEETKSEIQEMVKGSDMIFIAAGMGGGTGTGGAPVVARIAREEGVLTIGVVTKPFTFEGEQRKRIAVSGIEALEKEVDALIVIPNDKLLAAADEKTSFEKAFEMSDDILKQAVEGIAELITTPGIVNIDFADIRSVVKDAGHAFMGVGIAAGADRAQKAVNAAISSPLLEIGMSGARGVLFAISSAGDVTMKEVGHIADIVTENVDADSKRIFGTIRDTKMKKGQVKVTVIATGFSGQPRKAPLFPNPINDKEQDKKSKQAPKDEIIIDDNDSINEEGSSVPAFIRRMRGGK